MSRNTPDDFFDKTCGVVDLLIERCPSPLLNFTNLLKFPKYLIHRLKNEVASAYFVRSS